MRVHFMCAYYSQWAHENLAPRSQVQWDAFKFTRAVKNKLINKYMTFPWKNIPEERIDSSNVHRAREIFGVFIKHTLDEQMVRRPALVPVPSKCGLEKVDTYRSLEMVSDAVRDTEWSKCVEPVLRFTAQLQKAAAGGSRDRDFLRSHMKLIAEPRRTPVILIDDVITTGSSLLAAYDVLRAAGYEPVCAICCALTVDNSLTAPFGHHHRDYDPGPTGF